MRDDDPREVGGAGGGPAAGDGAPGARPEAGLAASTPPEWVRCPSCQAGNIPDAHYCERCGTELSNPEAATLPDLKRVIAFAYDEVGVRSAHDSSRVYVAAALTPLGRPGFGLHRRKTTDVCRAVYVPGGGAFQGAGATPQRFEDGAVIVKHGASIRLVQPASFEATYRLALNQPDGAAVRGRRSS